MFHRELKEMPKTTYYSGSHYGALESNEAWKARIEIAGLKATASFETANALILKNT
jgi:hypothetical protein